MEKMLSIVKTASRSSIYYCLRNKMQDLTEVSKLIQGGSTREVRMDENVMPSTS